MKNDSKQYSLFDFLGGELFSGTVDDIIIFTGKTRAEIYAAYNRGSSIGGMFVCPKGEFMRNVKHTNGFSFLKENMHLINHDNEHEDDLRIKGGFRCRVNNTEDFQHLSEIYMDEDSL